MVVADPFRFGDITGEGSGDGDTFLDVVLVIFVKGLASSCRFSPGTIGPHLKVWPALQESLSALFDVVEKIEAGLTMLRLNPDGLGDLLLLRRAVRQLRLAFGYAVERVAVTLILTLVFAAGYILWRGVVRVGSELIREEGQVLVHGWGPWSPAVLAATTRALRTTVRGNERSLALAGTVPRWAAADVRGV